MSDGEAGQKYFFGLKLRVVVKETVLVLLQNGKQVVQSTVF